jgi:hypothetical protein
VKKSFSSQELLHHESKPMHPSSSRAFQRDQEHNLKHPSSVDLMGTKQNKTNKISSFIERYPPNISKILFHAYIFLIFKVYKDS